ncbi:TPA: hypothetical protein HA241_01050 [Candidatus Woesearchaeota archaeon]|nr:hypothetical protein [Candidatus Woesearchaeota archaeon]
MDYFNIWAILAVVTVILLVIYWRRSAVWGGLTAGIIIGLAITLFSGFDWYVVGKGAIIGTMIGFGAELLGEVSDKMRKAKY